MSAASTSNYLELLTGKSQMQDEQAKEIYEDLHYNWGWESAETTRGGVRVIPISEKMRERGAEDVPEEGDGWSAKTTSPELLPSNIRGYSDSYREKVSGGVGAGNENVILQAVKAGTEYVPGSDKSMEGLDKAIESKAGIIDAGTVQGATPIQFDPRIVDIQRATATILTRIPQQSQAGFTASYNVISDRSEPIGMVTETDAADLSGQQNSDQTLNNAQKDMKIFVDKVSLSDYTVEAEDSLGYMNITDMTMGQRMIAHALFKATQYFYGDPSVGVTNATGYDTLESAQAYEGLAKMAVDAGNMVDKSSVTLSGDQPLLEDLKYEVTKAVEETGLTYNNAEFAVSPTFFDRLENEANVTTRLDAFDENVNFGGRQITIKQNVRVVECPNIRSQPWQDTTNFTAANTDVFLYDTSAVQFRSLMPLTAVPLGRHGLAERTALGEFGTLIDKSQGEHLRYLSSYPSA